MKNIYKGLIAAATVDAVYGAVQVTRSLMWFHNYCKLVPYEVKSIKGTELEGTDIKLTAHRGFRAVAPENTLPAYDKAGKAGFWGAECDIYRTKDGVWVLHHDPMTYRMMNKTVNPEKVTYDSLLKLHYTNGHNINDYPDLKICTLEEFYGKCEEYNMRAIVEIKYNRSIKYFEELVEMADRYNVETTYIAFDFEDVVRLREICDFPLYYLVYDIHKEQIEQAKTIENCGISYDGNDERNLANDGAMIKLCHEMGVHTATWAVDDLEIIKNLYKWGTKYITTNSVTY